ncbi:response regulator [bacterium]|nr:response regulator [bacterium]
MAEIKYDIRRGADIYRAIYFPRLKGWISTGKIKRGEVVVWRSGLSGWRRPEELEELIPFFEWWEKQQLIRKKPKRRKKARKIRIKSILIIDDEKDLCKLLDRILSPKGYNITIANTKREGIASIKREMPDLVFLDLKLPDGDGMKIIPKIREINPRAVVNIISAYGSEERREEARKKGVYTFIDKPFTEKKILGSIRELRK